MCFIYTQTLTWKWIYSLNILEVSFLHGCRQQIFLYIQDFHKSCTTYPLSLSFIKICFIRQTRVCVCAKKISLTPIKMHIKCLKNQTSDLLPLLLIGPKTFNNHDEQMFSQGSPRALSTYWDLILTQTLNETHAYNP